MLILFGSHARGDWVEVAETGYKSDYDFLIVVENSAQVSDVRNFSSWFDSAGTFWRSSRDAGARLWLKEAAFLLHQATERYYYSAILVHTGYKQRTHDIELLGNLAGEQHALMVDVLPKTEPEEKHLFDLLKRAYIDARYSMSYRISSTELATLQAQVLVLAERVREACLEKIATFCGANALRKDGHGIARLERGRAEPSSVRCGASREGRNCLRG